MKRFETGEIVYRGFYLEVYRGVDASRRDSPLVQFTATDLDRKTDELITVRGEDIVDAFTSASRYESVTQVTSTELARKLVSVGPLPFTVTYTKKDGMLRELTGILLEPNDLLGRSLVRDLKVSRGSPLRSVDHRTLKSLVVNEVKYELKEGK